MTTAGLDIGRTALLVVDVQQGFDEIDARGVPRNNPDALSRIVELLEVFRQRAGNVIHIRHASTEPDSVFRPERPGHAVMAAVRERDGEAVIVKTVNAAFIGTDLEQRLRGRGITTLVIAGATTNQCVETTARVAGNLGFDARVVRDATWTYERVGPDGERHAAESVHQMSLANLNQEFAEIVSTADVVSALGAGRG